MLVDLNYFRGLYTKINKSSDLECFRVSSFCWEYVKYSPDFSLTLANSAAENAEMCRPRVFPARATVMLQSVLLHENKTIMKLFSLCMHNNCIARSLNTFQSYFANLNKIQKNFCLISILDFCIVL